MSDQPGPPSALGIEAVEWLGQGTDNLTVRVRGRWRRRRPSWSGQPLLVIEAGGSRHRFPAMAEPPSLMGVAPGTWQMSFAVPASVAEHAGVRAWLQLGSVVVPLPVPVPVEPVHAAPVADEDILERRRVRGAELAAEAAARRAAEAQATASVLESRAAELERELERAVALVAQRERELRSAEQRAHAERALRQEFEERLARWEGAGDEEADTEQELRIAELELELERLRRAVDEAEYVARAARAGRHRAEQRLQELSVLRDGERSGRELGPELALAARARPAPSGRRRVSMSSSPAGDAGRLRAERQSIEARDDARERTERRVARAYDAIQEVRDELARLGAAPPPEPRPERTPPPISPPESPPPPISPPESPPPPHPDPQLQPPESAGEVQAERLAEALSRLRAVTPRRDDREAPADSGSRWLGDVLRSLARRDRNAAAVLLQTLLPASARDARAAARLLAGGPVRRRLRRGAGRARGRRALFGLLDELLRAPASLSAMRLEPWPALNLVAAMIDPAWSAGERFTIAFDSGPFLNVRGGDRPLASGTPLGAVATRIVCEEDLLPMVLMGERPEGTIILGEERPLELVQAWLVRAQSG